MNSTEDQATSRLTMTARFRPKGLLGILYWYAVVPLHHFVFGGMLNGIKRAAESNQDPQDAEHFGIAIELLEVGLAAIRRVNVVDPISTSVSARSD